MFMFPTSFTKYKETIDIHSDYYLERFDDFMAACKRYTETYKQPIVIVAPRFLEDCVSVLTSE